MKLRHVSLYTVSIYVNTILAALQGIVAAKFLSPYYMGYFSQIKVMLAYMMLINVGFINGFLIVLPKADMKTQREYIDAGFWASLILYIAGALIFLMLFLFTGERSFLFSASIFPVYGIKEIPIYIMRGKGDFRNLSIMYIITSVLSFVLISVLIYFFRYKGALMALSLIVLSMYIIGLLIGHIHIRFNVIRERIIELFKSGVMIYIKEFFRFLKSSMEKLIMIFIMPKEVYAVYTVGIVMISFFDILPSTIFQYLLPDFIRKEKEWSSQRMAKTVSVVTFIITALLLAGIYAFTLLIPIVLPHYAESLIIFYILTFTCFINIWNYLIYNKFVSMNKIKYMYISQFIGLAGLLSAIAAFYGIMGIDVSDMRYAALAILFARTAYIISLLIIFKAKTSINLFTKESILITTISLSSIILALLSVHSAVHIIPILLLVYCIIYVRRFIKWVRELI